MKNFLLFIALPLILAGFKPHPFFVSVTEIKFNEKSKMLELSCKMFINDLENALKKTTNTNVDILHPTNKAETEKVLFDYIKKRLVIKVNGKEVALGFIGYEKEEEAIWTYMECRSEKPKTILVDDKLLYDFLKNQINIVHADVLGNKQSSKVTNPESSISFSFQ